MHKILIVEDDEKLRNELKVFLEKNGYEVEILTDFTNTIEDILNKKKDLILLDINLPGFDGKYLLKEIRKTSDIPIIIITSRDSEMDELLSINYGADHYVTKPFNIQILLAKIASVLRRSKPLEKVVDKLECEGFTLNLSKSQIEKDDKKIELTKNELKILKFLIERKGKIVSREEIIEFLWDSETFIDDNTLTVNMTRLRNKLDQIGLKELIETKRGQGYILN